MLIVILPNCTLTLVKELRVASHAAICRPAFILRFLTTTSDSVSSAYRQPGRAGNRKRTGGGGGNNGRRGARGGGKDL